MATQSFVSNFHSIIKGAGVFTCLFILSSIYSLHAQNIGEWQLDNQLLKAYNQSLKFKIADSRDLLSSYPGDSRFGKLYLEHLNDALEVFTTEENKLFEEFEEATKVRVDQLSDEEDNPYKLFYLSSIKLHKTFIHLKFGEELSAVWNFRQAYLIAVKCREDYQDFDLILKNLGIMHIIIGSTPEKYHWILGLFGFRGTMKQGLEELNNFSDQNEEFSLESDIILAFVHSYLFQNNEKGLQIMNKYQDQINNHMLLTYTMVSLLIKSSKSEEALKTLEDYRGGNQGLFPFLEYLKGNILQQKSEYELSTASFEKFLSNYNGHNYIKDAYYKIGLNFWLRGDIQKAGDFFSLARKTGRQITEADKNASNMLENDLPDVKIMKLRLLTDGGYYRQAEKVINQIRSSTLSGHKDSVEFIYRQARYLHKSGNPAKAIEYYRETIEKSGNENWYFAPNSALQLGFIYMEKELNVEAAAFFEKAMSYRHHPYKNSIDNKAEAALSELNTK